MRLLDRCRQEAQMFNGEMVELVDTGDLLNSVMSNLSALLEMIEVESP